MTRSTPLPQNPRMYLLSALRHKLPQPQARQRAAASASCRRRRAPRTRDGDCTRRMRPPAAPRRCGARATAPSGKARRCRACSSGSPAGLSEALSDDERQLLVAVAENIPQREIAEWLGVSYAVARKRLERLRARLTDVAMRYANTLEPDDARELQRFFHRCRARIGARAVAPVETMRSPARRSRARDTEDEMMRRPPTDDRPMPQPEPRDERMASLRGQQLLAELAARAEMERGDSPYYADERVVALARARGRARRTARATGGARRAIARRGDAAARARGGGAAEGAARRRLAAGGARRRRRG